MRSLPELQQTFLHGLFARDSAERAPALFRDNGIASSTRFAVYRNNVLSNVRQTLLDTFPATASIVGEDFFRHMTTQYAHEMPSTSGDLGDLGAAFPSFVERFPGTEALPYLCDTARLEWALDRAFHAADYGSFDARRLAAVPPDRQAALRFTLHPSVQLIASDYPIFAIWSLTRDDAPADTHVDLADGGDWLLVSRALDFQPRIHRLSRGTFALLERLAANATIAEALDAALMLEPSLDLQATLAEHLQLGTIVDVRLDDDPD